MNDSVPGSPAKKLVASPRPLVIGHRGCCAFAPENTLPSFRMALEAGADLVELDYHQTRDGVPVVIHDPKLDHTTDARKQWGSKRLKVADRTAAEIQSLDAGAWFDPKFAGAHVPLLTEALDCICGYGTVALIERKSGDAAACVRLLREWKVIDRVVVISFDWQFLSEVRALDAEVVLGALGRPTHLADGSKPHPRKRRSFGGEWFDHVAQTGANLVVWNRQVAGIETAHERGLKVWVYTVNDVKLARLLIRIGVDGIITNEVELIRDALRPS